MAISPRHTISISIKFKALLAVIILSLLSSSYAETKIVKRKVTEVTKNGVKYYCYKVKKKELSVIKQKGKFILGSDAVKKLKESLTKSGKLKTKKGKKQLKALNEKIRNGNEACRNPGSDNGGSVSLDKLTRPLTRADVQYLLDKAALGLSSREEYMVNIGLNQGIDALVGELMKTHNEPSGLMDKVFDYRDSQLNLSTTQTPAGQRMALLHLWINTNNPYQEKFAMFLLSVWTAGGEVIEDETFRYVNWEYMDRLRTYAYSNDALPDLALAISRDPLMLVYLNNELNVKGNPNENFARELMELFTLGPTDLDGNPNYTETAVDGSGDIAVAAKMLTGWKVRKDYSINKLVPEYVASRHQNGPFTMFSGKPYAFVGENDEDLIRGIFANHPSAKIYYSQEILKLYLTPNPPRALVEKFADVIASNGYKLRPAMKSLLSSQAFYDSAYKDTVPMNSVEFAAKTARMLELYNAVNASYAEYQMQKMGLQFNMPPSVFWYNPDTWSSSSIGLEKANYLAEILSDSTAHNGASWSASKVLPQGAVTKDELVSFAQSKVGLTTLNDAQKQSINGYLSVQLQYDNTYTPFTYNNLNPEHQKTKGLGVYYLMFLTPEFNLL